MTPENRQRVASFGYRHKDKREADGKQQFGGAPASKTSYQDTSRGRGYDDAPRQTAYAEPSRADLEKHHWHLQRLKEMGFDNPSVTIPALEAHNMDITRTVDYLCSLPGHHFTSASPSSSSSRPAPVAQTPPAASYTNEVRQLASMGFNHEKDCREALAQCNGRVEDAINWLIEHHKGVSQAPQHTAPPAQKAPQQQQQQQASSAKDDLLDIFGPAVPAATPPPQQAPQAAAAKNDIMALFGAAPAPAFPPTPFANAAFGHFPPQQQQQQQQQQPPQMNNPFAGMAPSGNAPNFFGQSAQQAAPPQQQQQPQMYGSGKYPVLDMFSVSIAAILTREGQLCSST